MFICIPTAFIGKHPVMIQSSFSTWGSRKGGKQTCILFLISELNTFMRLNMDHSIPVQSQRKGQGRLHNLITHYTNARSPALV